ncbi:MAG: hypothetical protein ABID64_00185 [Nitrospirota bacterium]
MKKILIILIVLLIFPGCISYEQNTSENEEASYFEKNKDCYSYAEELRKKYEWSRDGVISTVESVFYSPKVDSCLYLYVWSGVGVDVPIIVDSELIDVFTNETILKSNKFVSEFQDEIKELGYMP